jgi:hypothetical protein
MPPLSGSLTRDEAAELLQLNPTTLDALLEGGQLLCHYRGGEPRIPLSELEAYLRDALVRLYRFEARFDPPAVAEGTSAPEQESAVDEAPVTAMAEASADEAVDADAPEPRPEAAVYQPPPAVFNDTRATPRYVPRRPITGIVNDVRFTIVQISASGLRIRHTEPLLPGDEAKLSFALLNPPRSFVMRARVVWTSAARYGHGGDANFSISGLRVTDHAERLAKAVDLLLAAHDLEPERRQHARRGYSAEAMTPAAATDEEIALVLKATQRFAADPLEATRWYGRGKFALSDEHVRRAAPPKARDREEALAVWEFLDRQVELEKVTSILAWSRKSRPAAVPSAAAT